MAHPLQNVDLVGGPSVGWATDGAAVGCYLLGMFLQGGGEAAVALSIRDEVEKIGVRGGDGGFERGDARVADWAWGQAGVAIGVVGRIELKVGGVNGAAIATLEQRSVDDARIGGERHALGEAVEEDSGDERTFGVLADLLLNQGGEDDGVGDGFG